MNRNYFWISIIGGFNQSCLLRHQLLRGLILLSIQNEKFLCIPDQPIFLCFINYLKFFANLKRSDYLFYLTTSHLLKYKRKQKCKFKFIFQLKVM